MLQLTWDKAHMNSIFSRRQPKQPKTTTKNACWRMQIGRKSIKNKQGRQSGEMKGGSEGRRMEFSTSVTLAGPSIMCDVVETGRWSESVRVGRLQARSHVYHPWIQGRIGCSYFCVHNRKHTVELVVFLDIHIPLQHSLFPLLCTRSRWIQRF